MAAIPARELPRRLAAPDAPRAFLITGDEPLQRQEATAAIRRHARAAGAGERLLFGQDGPPLRERILAELAQRSLFAAQRLLEIRCEVHGLDRKTGDTLAAALGALAPQDFLLATGPRLPAKEEQAPWYRACAGRLLHLAVWPVAARDLPRFLTERLAARGVRLAPEAARYLADRVEGNLLAAHQELERLLLLGLTEIRLPDLQGALGDNARFEVFALADLALAGDGARALRVLGTLRREGDEPLLVAFLLTRAVREAAGASVAADPGPGGGGWRRDAAAQAAARRLPRQRLLDILRLGGLVDATVKGTAPGDPWALLAWMCLGLAAPTWPLGPLLAALEAGQAAELQRLLPP